ncbi:hypothetical protein F4825DRAFT_457286 [Nemania diffusa]|nr:hypothetical protein F4825DRAFT_457286 [Nemania diffusa]
MPISYKGNLRQALPGLGMKYQSSHRLMHTKHREKLVTRALKDAGYQIKRATITTVLVNMFRMAAPIVAAARANGESLWDSLSRVQLEIDWARNLPETIFFDLVVRLVEARHEWEKAPQYPFYEYELYNPAVRELVTFLQEIGDYDVNHGSWVLTDAVIFNELARGWDIDEDEYQDVVMQDYNPEANANSDGNEDPTVADIIPPLAKMEIDEEEKL